MDDDDVWSDSEPGQMTGVQREHTNAGFIAGVTVAKNQALQPSFDQAFTEGARLALKAGEIIGFFQGLGLYDLEHAAGNELSSTNIFNDSFYDSEMRPKFDSIHPLIEKWIKRSDAFKDSFANRD